VKTVGVETQTSLESRLRAWGLLRAPFTLGEKSPELFPAHGCQPALEQLDQCATLRSVMLLSGAAGAGKSTLIKTWMHKLDAKRFLPLLITQSTLSASGVLEMLLAKLGERCRGRRAANLRALEEHLAKLPPVTLVLVLDDAQNYPASALEEVRLLLGLGGGLRAAFALVLLGDEYLLGSLRLSVQRALLSRIGFHSALRPLERPEIAPYLNWHFHQAGLHRDDLFEPAAVDLLAEASEGNPRTLNLLAQAAWLAATRDGPAATATSIAAAHVTQALEQVPAVAVRIHLPEPSKVV
jgi:general secretion pathway protein A